MQAVVPEKRIDKAKRKKNKKRHKENLKKNV
jgi:hypothetical protein